ncbi:hypothetical protein Adt_44620 [Abeliophyllum distichum]|uniref:Uncharacterized protein n=1 Tax=Abeliophyllum distichum TaxID=126358 RepID=A0ABD1PBE8_9LAMI
MSYKRGQSSTCGRRGCGRERGYIPPDQNIVMRKSCQLEKEKFETLDEEISSRDVLLGKGSRKPKHPYIEKSEKEFILFADKGDYNLDLHKYFDEDTYYIKRVGDIPPL